MALITFVLVVGYLLGQMNKFTPEELGGTLSSTFGWLLFELAAYRTAFYILNVPWRSMYELVAYSGYKYVAMVIVLISTALSGSGLVYHATVAWTAASLGFYLFNSMMGSIPPESEGLAVKRRKVTFLVIGVLQAIFIYWFSHIVMYLDVSIDSGDAPTATSIAGAE